ncbi:MAG: transcription antitermination protein NusB [Zunongwangia sp.]|nr:transcription antitermination protein NusB [Zunongwangia profunda]MAC65754.1 transcription antitermination protein NusB [Flavobacteriaceae bacterium]MAO37770.1 transcription antitermination protein NusB [Zunongwangia sp.]MAG88568.1 transcription antitermination protein NusB [Flavobacteriaceae bacterium]MAS72998.1 transcription antitermination protein NusB [Zunongwangia sp.]MCC4229786.1 transcription antitermination protein NusB [Zunongwangia profunda]|tara:strand:- start:995 stop:1939 length:945 start_codon:yes stop_codon:yes gene_type:complete
MLTRRHIRVKVMQSLYAFNQSENDNLASEEKFLLKSMEEMYDLFVLQLSLLTEIKAHAETFLERSQQKHLATQEDKDPNRKFVQNAVFEILEQNTQLEQIIDDRKLNHWKFDDEYVAILWNEIKESNAFADYMETRDNSFKEDKDFVLAIFKKVIAPNDKIYDYFEDKKLTWLDDLPLVNTAVVKMLQKLKQTATPEDKLPKLFKSIDDKEFAVNLFRKTYLKDGKLSNEMQGKTPNWDKDRIAEIDTVLLKMAICEFLEFPSIPVKVTINEYLEISKEYSTPKSSIFINGILDKLSKEYKTDGKLNKIGRGLM